MSARILRIRMILFLLSRLEFEFNLVCIDYVLLLANRKPGTKFIALKDVYGTMCVYSSFPGFFTFTPYLIFLLCTTLELLATPVPFEVTWLHSYGHFPYSRRFGPWY